MVDQPDPVKIALVLLTWNEAEALKIILPKLKDISELSVDEIFAVNRESTDGTREVLEEFGISVFNQPFPGRGEAMCFSAELTDANHLIFFSPDGNEDWNDIHKFRSYFEQGFDLVIANRMMKCARLRRCLCEIFHIVVITNLWRIENFRNNIFGINLRVLNSRLCQKMQESFITYH